MGYLFLAFLSMSFFGLYYFLVKILTEYISSLEIALISNVVALLFVYLYLYFSKSPILSHRKRDIALSLIISVPVAVGLIILYLAIERGPVSVVVPVIGLNSMVAVLLGIAILREKITLRKGLGVLLAVFAVVLLSV
jgi:transporter family protein